MLGGAWQRISAAFQRAMFGNVYFSRESAADSREPGVMLIVDGWPNPVRNCLAVVGSSASAWDPKDEERSKRQKS